MACEMMACSCSLCPYSCSENCPHYHDHDNDPRYEIYVEDRKGSYLDFLFGSDSLDEIKKYLNKKVLNKKKWNKKYLYSIILGEKIDDVYPNWKRIDFPYVEFTITDKRFWGNDIVLALDIENHKLYYYDPLKSDTTYGQNIHLKKEWDSKLSFRKKK